MAQPIVKALAGVKTNAHLCADALLVEVRAGGGALRVYRRPQGDFYDHRVMLGGRALTRARLPRTGTGLDSLAAGYGLDRADLPGLHRVRDRLNAPYEGIEEAADRFALFLGLLPDGLYLLLDHEAYPLSTPARPGRKAQYFWTGRYTDGRLLDHRGFRLGFGFGYGVPAYLFPSQSPAALDPGRLAHYRAMDPGGYRFPRALCIHLGGGMGLILDGHHKAAAAAHAGQRARCASILPLVPGEGLDRALHEGTRLTLNQNWGWGYPPAAMGGMLNVCGPGGVALAATRSFLDMAEEAPDGTDWAETAEGAALPAGDAPAVDGYPDGEALQAAVYIPKSRIKAAYAAFEADYARCFREGLTSYDQALCRGLRCGWEALGYRLISEAGYRRAVALDEMFRGREGN